MIFEHYKIEKSLFLNKKINLGEKGKCRYCGKSRPAVKFSKIAHAIPELLGNKFLFSNDECDECNSFFDKNFENNLANFMGIARTTSQIVGKKGVPKTKSSSGDRAESINGDIVVIQGEDSDMLESLDENTLKIQSSPTQYVPINVYKCFVKMAISALPEYALKGFSEGIRWVRYNHKPASFDAKTLKMDLTMVPGKNPFPLMWLTIFKRTGDKKKYPYMTCMLAFSNYMFHFVIPFSKKDKHLDLARFQLPIIPMINGLRLPRQAPNIKPTTRSIDLSENRIISTQNFTYMKTQEPMKNINLNEVPDEIKDRIKELGLEFKTE